MKFAIFGLSASVDIRQLSGAWVAELLGVVLRVQDHKKIKFYLNKNWEIWKNSNFFHFFLLNDAGPFF